MAATIDNEFAKHFPEIDLGEDDLDSLGLFYCYISVFSHWLSEQEAADNPLMYYSVASDAGELEAYSIGERRFLNLYTKLSIGGVICNRPRPLRKFEELSPELEQIFVQSLRERRLMDVYFSGYGTRVRGRYDRTDLVIADTLEQLDVVRTMAVECGLFELR